LDAEAAHFVLTRGWISDEEIPQLSLIGYMRAKPEERVERESASKRRSLSRKGWS
jgi:hypothetical protein